MALNIKDAALEEMDPYLFRLQHRNTSSWQPPSLGDGFLQ